MFNRVLIANRGEIACRIIHTAKRLGIRTVAVYSEADASARHVSLADEAVAIGPAPARDSYLVGEKLVEAAKLTGAEAIHPGYGFLSENAGFAEACETAGIIFVGPPPKAIELMGSKSAAKSIMQQAGIPLVPGYHGDNQDETFLLNEAEKIGFPVLLKASAGGGGRGMRVVTGAAEFGATLRSAKREALGAFNDDRMLLEKYLEKPRHIEIQIFCDNHGNAVHLFERDCSIQRRHQKVLEEAPAPGISHETREEMGSAAITAAGAIDYAGAGTVEFIVGPDGTFYFMEMNTRLQVEHPVTEFITGQDLVEWQFRVAAGEMLPANQDQLAIDGHALEARIYAEDPGNGFLPATGRLNHLRFPERTPHIRVDTGVREGDDISVHYDPLIAKLVAWDSDRGCCLQRMHDALSQIRVAGVKTNTGFLASVISHEAFRTADFDTGFIELHLADLVPDKETVSPDILCLAALFQMLRRACRNGQEAVSSSDPMSPWWTADSWRLNLVDAEQLWFHDGVREHDVTVEQTTPRHFDTDRRSCESSSPSAGRAANAYTITVDGRSVYASGRLEPDGRLAAILDNMQRHADVVEEHEHLVIFYAGHTYRLKHVPASVHSNEEEASGSLVSSMPGRVVEVMVSEGQRVKKGDALLVLEAMKVEHTITAPRDGTVQSLHYHEDELVEEGMELLALSDNLH